MNETTNQKIPAIPAEGEPDPGQTRREFFRRIGRNAALGGIALLAALTGGRGRPARRQTCVNRGVCRGCPAFEGCGLPQALSAKRAAPRG